MPGPASAGGETVGATGVRQTAETVRLELREPLPREAGSVARRLVAPSATPFTENVVLVAPAVSVIDAWTVAMVGSAVLNVTTVSLGCGALMPSVIVAVPPRGTVWLRGLSERL